MDDLTPRQQLLVLLQQISGEFCQAAFALALEKDEEAISKIEAGLGHPNELLTLVEQAISRRAANRIFDCIE